MAQRRLGAEVPEFRQKFPVLLGAPVVPKAQIWNSKKICLGSPPLKQFPNRTSNNFFLRSIFLSSMSASIKKKVSQNRTKLQQTTTTNNNKRPFFLPKINKVFLRPILQNLKGRSVLDKFFFENDPLDELNQMPLSKNFYLFRKLVKNAK